MEETHKRNLVKHKIQRRKRGEEERNSLGEVASYASAKNMREREGGGQKATAWNPGQNYCLNLDKSPTLTGMTRIR